MKNITLSADAHLIEAARQRTHHPERQVSRLAGRLCSASAAGGKRHGKNAYGDVKLLYSVSWLYRIKAFIFKKLPWKKLLADHFISVYRKKLIVIAQRRNSLR